MADQPIRPPYDNGSSPVGLPAFDDPAPRPIQAPRTRTQPKAKPVEDARGAKRFTLFASSLDKSLMVVVAMLLAVGLMMVYSTTFDWSYREWGSPTYQVMRHARNTGFGLIIAGLLALIDYRIWRRFSVWIMLVTITALVAVLLFGDETFGARRAFINGSYQPGEMAELTIIIYMAAWMGAKGTKIRSVAYGLIPFAILVGIVGALVLAQPDLSTAATIFAVCVVMYFLAGASVMQLFIAGSASGLIGWAMSARLPYAQDRIANYWAGLTDLTQADYHVQQAVIAFLNGGWTGVGLGQGRQKFGYLPAPHTDSIFAVIGEELGAIGAALVVLLYIVFVFRGFRIASSSVDPFGSLLAAGITVWVVTKALLNIAVMTSLVPPTGVALPFISFGGSSMVVLLSGVGLLLSVARVAARRDAVDRRAVSANHDRGWWNRGQRVSRVSRRGGDARPASES